MTEFTNDKISNEASGTLGSRIAQSRKASGLTQEDFSRLLGVTPQAVSKWENDVSCPDIMLLPKLSEVLSVSIDELMGVKQKAAEETEKSQTESTKEIPLPKDDFKKSTDVSKLKLRVNITDNRNKPIKIALPLPFVMRMANMGIKISGILGTSAITDSQLERILELVKNGVVGEIFDFMSDDGTKINIEIS